MNPYNTSQSLRFYQLTGFVGLMLVLGTIGAWATFTTIHGAVIASGEVVVESSSKLVQHREGGIVSAIHVRQGDTVAKGDPVLTLDNTETRAESEIAETAFVEALAKQARLIAQRDGNKAIKFPAELEDHKAGSYARSAVVGQKKLFASRRAIQAGKLDQMRQQISQFDNEINGLKAQIEAKSSQVELLNAELKNLKILRQKGLVRASRILGLEREKAKVAGEKGQLIAQISRIQARIGEAKLKVIQLKDEFLEETLSELGQVNQRISEARERLVALKAKLKRTTVIAPYSGVVHELAAHTIGGVVGAGQVIMKIVPNSDDLIVEARVRPRDIDQVRSGQTAILRFSGFDQRTMPQLYGAVRNVSADLTVPAEGGDKFYQIEVKLTPDALNKISRHNLKPGMPVEAFIQTDERSPISYLLQPLSNQVARAFRER